MTKVHALSWPAALQMHLQLVSCLCWSLSASAYTLLRQRLLRQRLLSPAIRSRYMPAHEEPVSRMCEMATDTTTSRWACAC